MASKAGGSRERWVDARERWVRAGGMLSGALPVAALIGVSLWSGSATAVASATGCFNEQIRGQEGAAMALPDCRAYEQVSPVDKNFADADGGPGTVQGSPSGETVTYFSTAPFPGVSSAASVPTYLSTRGGEDWSTEGLAPPVSPFTPGGSEEGLTEGLTEDLGEALVLVNPGLEAGMAPGVYSYLHSTGTGSFQLLAPGAATLADASTDDSRIIFESSKQLLTKAAPDVVNLYEWNEDGSPGHELSLVGVLPGDKAPIEGSFAGPGGPALDGLTGGAAGKFYTQNTISADGSRVFFSDAKTGVVYMRETEAIPPRTIQISAGVEPAYWQAATTSGSYVFYTEGEDLYRFNVDEFEASKRPEAEALAEAREELTSGSADVLGVLGTATESGDYTYFAAGGILASNENNNKEVAEVGRTNLYVWHRGDTAFIAQLGAEEEADPVDWRGFFEIGESQGPAQGEKSSRVTPDGQTVLFTSQARLTSYDNAEHDEVYVYDASINKIVCVSCNPSGAPATSDAYLANNGKLSVEPDPRAFLARNLSANGNRVFFQTQESLVSQDTSGQTNVYEWERDGEGTCERASVTFSAASDGCLYLISTGQSDQPSYFGDASANGDDVFFFTRQPLVGQDDDENYDIYDARIDGGIAAQNPVPSTPCAGEECRAAQEEPPVFGPPASSTITGAGNYVPPPAVPEPSSKKASASKKRSNCVAKRGKGRAGRRVCRTTGRGGRRKSGGKGRKSAGKGRKSGGKGRKIAGEGRKSEGGKGRKSSGKGRSGGKGQ